MNLIVNGESRTLEVETVADLLAVLSLAPGRLACEVQGRLVRRADYALTRLKEGDTVEIVQMIGGG